MTYSKPWLAGLLVWMAASVSLAQEARGQDETAQNQTGPTEIVLEKDVYFLDLNSATVLVPAGLYKVDAAYGTLVLFDESGIARAIQARWEPHELNLEWPIAVSLAGETEADADYHFVSVLMPGGSGLEAGGTYSGVRPRGLLSAAKKKVQSAAQGVQRQTQAVANQAQRRTQQAVSNTQQAAKQAAGTVAEAIPTAEIQQLIKVANQLRLQELLSCLQGARDQRRTDLVTMISSMQSNPVGFVGSIQNDISASVTETFPQVVGPALNLVRTGAIPTAGQVVSVSYEALNVVAQQRPATKCIFDFMQPYLPAIQQGADEIVTTAQAKAFQVFERSVQPVLEKAVVAAVKKSIGEGGDALGISDAEVRVIAMGVYARSLREQYQRSAAEIKQAVGSGDAAAVRAAIVSSNEWQEDTTTSFAFEMLRVRGRSALESVVTDRVTTAIGTLSLSEDTIDSIAEAVCGLVPEVGGAACSLVKYPVKVGWNIIGVRVLKKLAETSIERSYEIYMACLAGRMGISIPPETYLPSNDLLKSGRFDKVDVQSAGLCSKPSPWRGFLDDRQYFDQVMQQVVAEDLPVGMQEAVDAYNSSILTLANSWESGNGGLSGNAGQ
jgi:hypothetical protein